MAMKILANVILGAKFHIQKSDAPKNNFHFLLDHHIFIAYLNRLGELSLVVQEFSILAETGS